MSSPAPTPRTHHAVVAETTGGPEVLQWTETEVPSPAPGHVLVRTAAAGLNFIETYQRSGVYTMDLPFTPGTEGSGEVVALGEGVDAALLGARVATATATGAYAEHFTAPADRLLAVPEGIDLAEAAALDLAEVEQVYLPISRLLAFYEQNTAHLHEVTSDFLGERPQRTPFIIGVAGSVAVGKSTTARILRELMQRWPDTPKVDLVTTDGRLIEVDMNAANGTIVDVDEEED